MKLNLCCFVLLNIYFSARANHNATSHESDTLNSTESTEVLLYRNQENVTVSIQGWHRKEPDNKISKMTTGLRMATPCLTPGQEAAWCVEIKQCPALVNLWEINKDDAFIAKSRCGPRNENTQNPKVCCSKPKVEKKPVCGKQKTVVAGRILGGREAAIGEFPWMARLMHRSRHGFMIFGCSGSLIHPKYILTAAHCLNSSLIETLGPLFEVVLGEHNTETDVDCTTNKKICADKPQILRVKKTIYHHKYDQHSPHHLHDIGLVQLRKPAIYTDYVYPICLLQEHPNLRVEYWISGWGKTENADLSPVKMKLGLRSFDLQNCTKLFKEIGVDITKNQICAGGEKRKDSCNGDSGGPLMVYLNGNQWFAAGVVSYGVGCGRQGWPGIYTSVTKYYDWIAKEIYRAKGQNRGVKRVKTVVHKNSTTKNV